MVSKKSKLKEQIDALQAEYDQLDTMQEQYEASIKIGEDGGTPHGCYAYCGESQQLYEGVDGKFTRDNNTEANLKTFVDVTPVYENGATLGSITLGANMSITGGFGNVDNASLVITGMVEGYDYAAAAAKLAEEITSAQSVEAAPEGEPVSVSYYDLSGKKTSQPSGITIKVETYKNGYMKVSKAIVK